MKSSMLKLFCTMRRCRICATTSFGCAYEEIDGEIIPEVIKLSVPDRKAELIAHQRGNKIGRVFMRCQI